MLLTMLYEKWMEIQELKVEGADTKRFVLVHGGGFGAWCWYKTITLLEKHGFQVDAVDLTGSGVSSFDTNNITSLAQYVKPLLQFFETLKPTEKVLTSLQISSVSYYLFF